MCRLKPQRLWKIQKAQSAGQDFSSGGVEDTKMVPLEIISNPTV